MEDCRAVLNQIDQAIRVLDNTVVGVERAWGENEPVEEVVAVPDRDTVSQVMTAPARLEAVVASLTAATIGENRSRICCNTGEGRTHGCQEVLVTTMHLRHLYATTSSQGLAGNWKCAVASGLKLEGKHGQEKCS